MGKSIVLEDREWIEIKDTNGAVTGGFYWNPTDLDIVNRCEKVVDYFNNLKVPEDATYEDLITMSDDIKKQFDFLLNSDGASDELFKNCKNVFSPREDGQLFCEYVLDVLTKFIESEMDVRMKKTTDRMKKYTSKYQK